MINPPRTLGQAMRQLYYQPGGQFELYDEDYCAYAVRDFKLHRGRQCSRSPGHGPAKLYCKQHAKMVERGKV